MANAYNQHYDNSDPNENASMTEEATTDTTDDAAKPTTAPAEVRQAVNQQSIYVCACNEAFDNLITTLSGGQYTIEELRYLFARTMQIGQSLSGQIEEAERHFSEQKRLADGYDEISKTLGAASDEAMQEAMQEGRLMHVQVAEDEDGNILSVTAEEVDEVPPREEQN